MKDLNRDFRLRRLRLGHRSARIVLAAALMGLERLQSKERTANKQL